MIDLVEARLLELGADLLLLEQLIMAARAQSRLEEREADDRAGGHLRHSPERPRSEAQWLALEADAIRRMLAGESAESGRRCHS